jgi:hypothetical protein
MVLSTEQNFPLAFRKETASMKRMLWILALPCMLSALSPMSVLKQGNSWQYARYYIEQGIMDNGIYFNGITDIVIDSIRPRGNSCFIFTTSRDSGIFFPPKIIKKDNDYDTIYESISYNEYLVPSNEIYPITPIFLFGYDTFNVQYSVRLNDRALKMNSTSFNNIGGIISINTMLYLDSIGALYYFNRFATSAIDHINYWSLRKFNGQDIDSSAIVKFDSATSILRKNVAFLRSPVVRRDNKCYLLNGRMTKLPHNAVSVMNRKLFIRFFGH